MERVHEIQLPLCGLNIPRAKSNFRPFREYVLDALLNVRDSDRTIDKFRVADNHVTLRRIIRLAVKSFDLARTRQERETFIHARLVSGKFSTRSANGLAHTARVTPI